MALELIGKPIATWVAKQFGSLVIERWSRHRAEKFFEAFVSSVNSETPEVDAEERLLKILQDEKLSEVLFESYRKVCLSKSRTIGPRIIGLLTAQIVGEGRRATGKEEDVFEAAENLADSDFLDFFKDFSEILSKAIGILDSAAEYNVAYGYVMVRSDLGVETSHPIGGEGWIDVNYGPWGRKLKQLGLVTERVDQDLLETKSYDGSEKATSARIVTSTSFYTSCDCLLQLTEKALGMGQVSEV